MPSARTKRIEGMLDDLEDLSGSTSFAHVAWPIIQVWMMEPRLNHLGHSSLPTFPPVKMSTSRTILPSEPAANARQQTRLSSPNAPLG